MSQLGLAPIPILVNPSPGISTNAKNVRGRRRDIRDMISHRRDPRQRACIPAHAATQQFKPPGVRRQTIDYLAQRCVD